MFLIGLGFIVSFLVVTVVGLIVAAIIYDRGNRRGEDGPPKY